VHIRASAFDFNLSLKNYHYFRNSGPDHHGQNGQNEDFKAKVGLSTLSGRAAFVGPLSVRHNPQTRFARGLWCVFSIRSAAKNSCAFILNKSRFPIAVLALI
jgi:hypothetical protein